MPRMIQNTQQLVIKALPRKRMEGVKARWDRRGKVNWEEEEEERRRK
jgi:hypothetical protein